MRIQVEILFRMKALNFVSHGKTSKRPVQWCVEGSKSNFVRLGLRDYACETKGFCPILILASRENIRD